MVLVFLVAGAAGLLLATSQDWGSAEVEQDGALSSTADAVLAGSEVSPLAAASGWAALAALAAVLATRGWPRRLVGVVVTLLGGAAVVDIVRGLRSDPQNGQSVTETATTAVESVTLQWVWPVTGIAAAVVLLLVGVVIVVRGDAWPAMSARYDRDGGTARAVADPDDSTALWHALSSGVDPTVTPSASPPNTATDNTETSHD